MTRYRSTARTDSDTPVCRVLVVLREHIAAGDFDGVPITTLAAMARDFADRHAGDGDRTGYIEGQIAEIREVTGDDEDDFARRVITRYAAHLTAAAARDQGGKP